MCWSTCATPRSAKPCCCIRWRSTRCMRRARCPRRSILPRWATQCRAESSGNRPRARRNVARRRAAIAARVARAQAHDVRPSNSGHACRPLPASTRRMHTSGRSAWALPRAGGESTTAFSKWASRRSKSRAEPWRPGCCATTTRACRTRCICTGSHFEVLARETSPDAIAALAVDAQGRLPTDLGRKDTVLVWPGESVRVAIDFTPSVSWTADLHVPLPQPRARGRRDDAGRGGDMRTRPLRPALAGGGVRPVTPPESADLAGKD